MRFGSVAGNISSLQITRYSKTGHRLSVPVKPSQTVFAQYRSVSGIPASSGQRTVPLSKVQLLNSLINNLQKIKHNPDYKPETSHTSPERADAMIKQYAAELHSAMQASPAAFGSSVGTSGSGMVFSLSA